MPHTNYVNKIFMYTFLELVSIFFRRIRLVVLPYCWPSVSKFLQYVSKSSTSYYPNILNRNLVYVLVNDDYPIKPTDIPGINLDISLENWLITTLNFKKITLLH